MTMPPLPKSVRLKITATQRRTRSQLSSLGGLQSPANPTPDATGVRSADVTMDEASLGLWAPPSLDTTTENAHRPLPVVVYFHGGGFVSFSPASRPYDAFCRRLCRELRAVVVSVSYLLAPRHRFPATYNDGVAALRYLAANNDSLPADVAPINISSCFLAGDSSGGNITHHVAHRWSSIIMSSSSSSSMKNLHITGVVLIQPLFGGEERTAAELELANVCPILTLATADYYWREFLPEGTTRDHEAARVHGDNVDMDASFPPMMVVVGGFDLLKDRHVRYVEELRQRKKNPVRMVEYPNAIHGFYIFPEIDDSIWQVHGGFEAVRAGMQREAVN
ncbi:hypothetical protein QOZ80_8BG0669210 [Eleusine coracana subsp. coracana]|nr:hypothetical protein QOZ80_8BG0669210 [Eleusine coracana subsp. coracana]